MFQSLRPSRRQVSRGLVCAALAGALRPLESAAGPNSGQADRIVVLKSRRKLLLLRGGRTLAIFRIALGARPIGPKLREGDSRTPEGLYYIDELNPHSHFHLALHISYPSARDVRRAFALGVPPGGNIEIHGMPDGYGRFEAIAFGDWTNGCIAVSNRAIEAIWARAGIGTPVVIRA
jgi:murein L,D-transpeptidase YafK